MSLMKKRYDEIVRFFSIEFVYHNEMQTSLAFDRAMKFLEENFIISLSKNKFSVKSGKIENLKFYASIVRDYVESYYIVLATLIEVDRKITIKDFMARVKKSGTRMLHLGEIAFHESLSVVNFRNAIKTFEFLELVEQKSVRKRVDIHIKDANEIGKLKLVIEKYLYLY